MGYHKAVIPKSKYGTSDKIMEEVLELKDSEDQGAKIMALCELADIIGAVRGYLEFNHCGISFEDLVKMADITRSAFQDGQRK